MKSDKRTIFLFIYALIIIVALIYILFIAPDSNFYSKETKEFIKNYNNSQSQTVTLDDMFENLYKNDYQYTYNILDSVGNENTIYKCSGTVTGEKEQGSCTKPNDIVYDETNKKEKLKQLNFDLLDLNKIQKITQDNEASKSKYDNLDAYKYKDKIDTLSTDINIYTNSKDIVQIEISNGYETYVIKFNNINY